MSPLVLRKPLLTLSALLLICAFMTLPEAARAEFSLNEYPIDVGLDDDQIDLALGEAWIPHAVYTKLDTVYHAWWNIGGVWTSEVVLPGDAYPQSDPTIAVTPDGVIHVAFRRDDGSQNGIVAHAWKDGPNWSMSTLVSGSYGGGWKGSLSADDSGALHYFCVGFDWSFYYKKVSGGSWNLERTITDQVRLDRLSDLAADATPDGIVREIAGNTLYQLYVYPSPLPGQPGYPSRRYPGVEVESRFRQIGLDVDPDGGAHASMAARNMNGLMYVGFGDGFARYELVDGSDPNYDGGVIGAANAVAYHLPSARPYIFYTVNENRLRYAYRHDELWSYFSQSHSGVRIFEMEAEFTPTGSLHILAETSTGLIHLTTATYTATPPATGAGYGLRVLPNPAESEFFFRVEDGFSGPAQFEVYDARGRRVWQTNAPALDSGSIVSWDTLDGNGAPVGAGVYFLQVQVGGTEGFGNEALIRRKLTVLR